MAHDRLETDDSMAPDGKIPASPDGPAVQPEDNLPETDLGVDDDISLESILAEYKGTAYMNGDKKTPPSVLREKTEKIVSEEEAVLGGRAADISAEMTAAAVKAKTDEDLYSQSAVSEAEEPEKPVQPAPKTPKKVSDDTGRFRRGLPLTGRKMRTSKKLFEDNRDVISFEEFQNAEYPEEDEIARGVEDAIDKETDLEEEHKKAVRNVFSLFRKSGYREDAAYDDESDNIPEEEELPVEEEVFEEPDYKTAAKNFALHCNSYSLRSFASFIIAAAMTVMTFVFSTDGRWASDRNLYLATGVLLALMFLSMIVSMDQIVKGVGDLFAGKPGAETLNLFSCLASAGSGVYTLFTKDLSVGMPFCAVSALTLTMALWGEKIYYKALTETMKTAVGAAVPDGVVADINPELNKSIVRKASGRTAGFYNNLVQEDIAETAYRYASPILIVASFALAFYASVGHGHASLFPHHLAAVMAAAAPLSSLLAFAIPFSSIARRLRKMGAALAGWGGADDLFHTDGACVTDEDLFPTGNVSISGIKIFDNAPPEKAIRYTSSLIAASGSTLSKLFITLLSKQSMNLIKVEDFTAYEGGIGGTIRQERVLAGNAAFMNLMGIRIPAGLNMKNAAFTAVNKQLIAAFTLEYVPVKSVQNALVAAMSYRIKLFFAVRDFGITPIMVEQKYKISVDDVEYIPIQNSYDLSDGMHEESRRVPAILTREGLAPFVESLTGARRLRSTSLAATVFSIFSACLGMMIMFVICWSGSVAAAGASNLLLFMLAMLVAVLVVTGFAKFRQ